MPRGGYSGGVNVSTSEAPRAVASSLWLHVVLALALAALLPLGFARAAEEDELKQPRIRKVGPHLYQVGTVLLDAEKKTVRCRGKVNMDTGGPIELLACLPRGKTHETVFVLDVVPLDLQLALLLLDLRSGRNPSYEYPENNPDADRPPGDSLRMWVEWQPPRPSQEEDVPEDQGAPDGEAAEAEPVRVPAEQFLYNVQSKEALKEAKWVFLGSRLLQKGFGADLDGSLISTYHDPLAILELQHETVRDDIFYDVNGQICPPVGTPVDLVIQVPPEKDKEGENGNGENEEDDRASTK